MEYREKDKELDLDRITIYFFLNININTNICCTKKAYAHVPNPWCLVSVRSEGRFPP